MLSVTLIVSIFNAIALGKDGWESHLPGRMPKSGFEQAGK